MLNVRELRACMVRKGYTQMQLAKELGMTPKTFGVHINQGTLGLDDAAKLIRILDIKDPMPIFFDTSVTSQVSDSISE